MKLWWVRKLETDLSLDCQNSVHHLESGNLIYMAVSRSIECLCRRFSVMFVVDFFTSSMLMMFVCIEFVWRCRIISRSLLWPLFLCSCSPCFALLVLSVQLFTQKCTYENMSLIFWIKCLMVAVQNLHLVLACLLNSITEAISWSFCMSFAGLNISVNEHWFLIKKVTFSVCSLNSFGWFQCGTVEHSAWF